MGCGASKRKKTLENQNPNSNDVKDEEVQKKQMKQMEGLLVNTKLDYQLTLNTGDPLGSAISALNVIMTMIQADINKNQLAKALAYRIKNLHASLTDLKKQNLKIAQGSLSSVNNVVNELQKLIEYIQATPSSIFERVKKFVTSSSDLQKLGELDMLLTKSLDDLKIPLSVEQMSRQKQQMEEMKKIYSKVDQLIQDTDQAKVLGLSKMYLTNEEALTFWIDCFPYEYAVKTSKFKTIFKAWLEAYKNIKFTAKEMNSIIYILDHQVEDTGDQEEDLEMHKTITAKQINTFFEFIPIDADWSNVANIEHYMSKEYQDDKNQIKNQEEQEAKRNKLLIDELAQQVTPEELIVKNDSEYTLFFVKKATIQQDTLIQMNIKSVYIHRRRGYISIFGSENKGVFIMQGQMQRKGQINLQKTYTQTNIVHRYIGQIDDKLRLVGEGVDENGSQLQWGIEFDLTYWYGYTKILASGYIYDSQIYMKYLQTSFYGLLVDSGGVEIWEGTIDSQNKVQIRKTCLDYITEHGRDYMGLIEGICEKKGYEIIIQGNERTIEEDGVPKADPWCFAYLSLDTQIKRKNNVFDE